MTETFGLDGYADQVRSRLSDALGTELLGLWLLGSGALGGFDPERSDIDLLLVTRTVAPVDRRRAVAELIGPRTLPCPAQGLEFVWYARAEVRPLGDPPQFQLNLNGGPQREHKLQFGPGPEAAHWFVIDLAIGRETAVPLAGPPLAEVAAPIPLPRLLTALTQSLTWHDHHVPDSPNRVLNAARAVRFLRTGTWTGKLDAATWLARTQPSLASPLTAARMARRDGLSLPPALGAPVITAARAALHHTLDRENRSEEQPDA
jgi:hypothetical protein